MTNQINNLSHKNVETFIHDSLLCIFFFNTDTKKIVYANPSFCRLLGYSTLEIEALTLYDFYNYPKELVDSFINHVLKTKMRKIGEREWKSKEGKVIDMYVNTSHGKLDDSNIMFVSGQDISQHKKTERELLDSERFLMESQKVSKIGSYSTDLTKEIWRGSEELGRIFGVSPNDYHSIEFWISIIHPEHKKTVTDYFELEVLAQKKRFDKEYKIINQKTQEERWVHGIGELEFDFNENPIKMTGTIQDITERKHAQQEIIDSEKKFRSVLKSAKDSIVLANDRGEIIFWNHWAEKIFDYKESEVYGKPLSLITPERFRYAHQFSFAKQVSTNQDTERDSSIELYGLKKNGTEFPIELTISHWVNESENFYCAIIRDVSERKLAEEEQIKNIQKLSDIAFLHSHHVRAPIASILGLINLINFERPEDPNNIEVFRHLKNTSLMCDKVIKEIIKTASEIEY